jgi:hypothetical protein
MTWVSTWQHQPWETQYGMLLRHVYRSSPEVGMRAFVSDQSGNFGSLVIGTGPDFTVVAALELPPGSWVASATVALAMGVSSTPTDVEAGLANPAGRTYTTGPTAYWV